MGAKKHATRQDGLRYSNQWSVSNANDLTVQRWKHLVLLYLEQSRPSRPCLQSFYRGCTCTGAADTRVPQHLEALHGAKMCEDVRSKEGTVEHSIGFEWFWLILINSDYEWYAHRFNVTCYFEFWILFLFLQLQNKLSAGCCYPGRSITGALHTFDEAEVGPFRLDGRNM